MKIYNHFEEFEPHVGTVFLVPLDDGTAYPLTLTSATRRENMSQISRPPFDLRFSGPGPGYLQQQTYVMQHEAMGSFSMFIVPIGQEADGFRYQAIFN
jgi:hypothetical protein